MSIVVTFCVLFRTLVSLMKEILKKALGIAIVFLFCLATHVNAQETDYTMADETEDNNVDYPYAGENAHAPASPTIKIKKTEKKPGNSTEGKSATYRSHSAVKRGTQAQPEQKKTKRPDVTDGEVEDSVLSFNFLYYMIQKFKFSDVVDE